MYRPNRSDRLYVQQVSTFWLLKLPQHVSSSRLYCTIRSCTWKHKCLVLLTSMAEVIVGLMRLRLQV